LLLAEGEEAYDVRVADAEERLELLAEDAVEALAAAVDLDGGEGAGEAREVDGAEAALAHHGGGEAARHPLHLRPRQLPRAGLVAPLRRPGAAALRLLVDLLHVAGGRIGPAAAAEESEPLPHRSLSLSVLMISLGEQQRRAKQRTSRAERGRRLPWLWGYGLV
jgi:hypothetical protein